MVYYKNKKLSSTLIKNNPFNNPDESHVVYQYTCPETACQQSQIYVGYTTTTVKQRMTTHAQNESILSYSIEAHDKRVRTQEILQNIKVLYKSSDKNDLIVAEALYIKALSPTLNNQREGETRVLKIF